jgi:hypothetical protein
MEEKNMANETNETERRIIDLIAADRLYRPVSSLGGKLERMRPKLAALVSFAGDSFQGERVYARVETGVTTKSKGMRTAIEQFASEYPVQGAVLKEMIAEQRQERETNLYFGINSGCRLDSRDYMQVMANLGFNERQAIELYPALMDVSRRIAKERDEERSILIG